MNKSSVSFSYVYILIACIIWGMLGPIGKVLFNLGFDSSTVAFSRLFFGCIFLFIYILITDKKALKIDFKGLVYTFILGLICQFAMNYFYFNSIKLTSISTGVVLLYTAPIFTLFYSAIIFKEKLTPLKVLALPLCILGCFLTATNGVIDYNSFNLIGVVFGILSGACYGAMPVLSKKFMTGYKQTTILFYSFAFGAFFLSFLSTSTMITSNILNTDFWIAIIGLGLFTSVVSYAFYMKGLENGAEPSQASMICTFEVVVAAILAYLLFKEPLSYTKCTGIALVISSVLLIQLSPKLSLYATHKKRVA